MLGLGEKVLDIMYEAILKSCYIDYTNSAAAMVLNDQDVLFN